MEEDEIIKSISEFRLDIPHNIDISPISIAKIINRNTKYTNNYIRHLILCEKQRTFYENLSQETLEALIEYKGYGFESMNNELRHFDKNRPYRDIYYRYYLIDRAFLDRDVLKTEETIILFRGCDDSYSGLHKAYISTTFNFDIALTFAKKVGYIIMIPKGTPYIYMEQFVSTNQEKYDSSISIKTLISRHKKNLESPDISDEKFAILSYDECEILLPRNLKIIPTDKFVLNFDRENVDGYPSCHDHWDEGLSSDSDKINIDFYSAILSS